MSQSVLSSLCKMLLQVISYTRSWHSCCARPCRQCLPVVPCQHHPRILHNVSPPYLSPEDATIPPPSPTPPPLACPLPPLIPADEGRNLSPAVALEKCHASDRLIKEELAPVPKEVKGAIIACYLEAKQNAYYARLGLHWLVREVAARALLKVERFGSLA